MIILKMTHQKGFEPATMTTPNTIIIIINWMKNRSDEKYSDKNILNANCKLIDSYKNI